MKSWIMKLWLETHDESEWPDLSTCQPQDGCHVTCLEQHPSNDNIEKMCSPDFFSKHKYKYVCRNFGMAGGKDDYSEANGTSDVPFTGDISPVYSSCSEVEENPELVPVPDPQKPPNNNDAGYLCPVSITVEDLSSTESKEENDAGVAESTRGDGQGRVVPAKKTFNLQVKKIKKRSGAHGSSAIDMNGGKASLPEDTPASPYVNVGTQQDQQHTSLYQNIDAIPKETSSKHEECVEGAKVAYPNPTEKRNRGVYPKVKRAENTPGLEDQLVPPNDKLYANLVASSDVTHALSLSDMESKQWNMETMHEKKKRQQNLHRTDGNSSNRIHEKDDAEKNGRNFTPPVWLKDPKLQVTFFVNV